jgi:hypothetical protein
MEQLFIKASREKLRFPSSKGQLTVEQLWDLPLTSKTGKVNLDELAVAAFNDNEATPTVSFVETTVRKNTAAETRLEILKYIIAAKQAENSLKLEAAAKAAEKAELLELLATKQKEGRLALSEAEIKARIASL